MASERGPTTIAIIIGAAVGAIAALWAKGPEQAATPSVPAMSSESARVRSDVESGSPPSEPTVDQADATAPVREPAAGLPPDAGGADASTGVVTDAPKLDEVPLAQAELGCGRRAPSACLSAARAHAEGRGTRVDAAKARLFRSMAVSMYDEACTGRDPEACHELGAIFRSGLVAPPYPEAAQALAARARELCSGKTSAFCSELGAH